MTLFARQGVWQNTDFFNLNKLDNPIIVMFLLGFVYYIVRKVFYDDDE